jgi:hypothetical protein
MALSVLVDGDLAGIGDVNQYYNLLTGVTTDQPVELNYRPGSGTTPTLLLDGDGHGPLIKGLKTDHSTQAFKIDASGNLTLAGTLTMVGALTGVTSLTMSGALAGPTTGNFSSYVRATTFRGPSGVGASIGVHDSALGTVRDARIFIGTTDPSTYTTVNEGDIWIKA